VPASLALRLERQIHRLFVRQGATHLAPENFEGATARKPAHLLQPLNRNQGGERFALALDNELLPAQRDLVEQIADMSPHVEGGDFFWHVTPNERRCSMLCGAQRLVQGVSLRGG
jgi:hypothetical protein